MILTHTLLSTNRSITVELPLLQLQKHSLKNVLKYGHRKRLGKISRKKSTTKSFKVSGLQEDFAKLRGTLWNFSEWLLLTLLSDFFLLLHLQLHGPKSHSSVSTRTPVQSAPLFSGFGFVQVRIRTLVPKPQVTLHGEYSDHTLQAPFTKSQS